MGHSWPGSKTARAIHNLGHIQVDLKRVTYSSTCHKLFQDHLFQLLLTGRVCKTKLKEFVGNYGCPLFTAFPEG